MAKLHYTFEDGQYQNPFTVSLNSVLCHIDSAMAYNASLPEQQPRCAGCPSTENLTQCRATSDGVYQLCPRCKREGEMA